MLFQPAVRLTYMTARPAFFPQWDWIAVTQVSHCCVPPPTSKCTRIGRGRVGHSDVPPPTYNAAQTRALAWLRMLVSHITPNESGHVARTPSGPGTDREGDHAQHSQQEKSDPTQHRSIPMRVVWERDGCIIAQQRRPQKQLAQLLLAHGSIFHTAAESYFSAVCLSCSAAHSLYSHSHALASSTLLNTVLVRISTHLIRWWATQESPRTYSRSRGPLTPRAARTRH